MKKKCKKCKKQIKYPFTEVLTPVRFKGIYCEKCFKKVDKEFFNI